MPLMQRIAKAKTQRGKRALQRREPKLIENEKTAIFIRGQKASGQVLQCMKDLAALKRPNGIFYSRKNDMLPFEDPVKLEGFAKKHDASLFMFGNHNKKRPHNVIIGRTYDQHVLDMIELGLESYKGLQEFKVPKTATGTKPLILFWGEPFEHEHEYRRLKNLLLDFFRGPQVQSVRLAGLEHVLMFTAMDGKIHFRSYKVLMKKSGTKVPRIELEEMGPSADLVLRRSKLASDDLFKRAKRQPRQLKKKKVKNITRDSLGSRLGRVHMQRQDLGRLQTRKMKGLRKTPEQRKMDKKVRQHLKRKRDQQTTEKQDVRPSKVKRITQPKKVAM